MPGLYLSENSLKIFSIALKNILEKKVYQTIVAYQTKNSLIMRADDNLHLISVQVIRSLKAQILSFTSKAFNLPLNEDFRLALQRH